MPRTPTTSLRWLLVATLAACGTPDPSAAEPHSDDENTQAAKAPPAAPADPAPASSALPSVANLAPTGRIVAIGDLHADLDNALAVMKLAGLVDDDGHWAGGDTTFVQTGDLTDRGPDSKELIDLMRRLGPEASAAGGQVVSLLGNHETMNMLGDWRYVHPGDLEHFGGAEARRKALALDGEYGAWLVQRNVVARVGDTVFVHGGVHPAWARRGIDTINEAARSALTGGAPDVLGPDGPLWFRAYVNEPEEVACGPLGDALASMGAVRMVVGHTTRRDGKIQSRCGGRLHVIDIGIADHYGGNLGAWEWSNGDTRALYPSGTVDLEDPPK